LNDSTGAIILLLKMFLLALLWTMRRAREEIKHRFAVALVTTGTVWLLALVIAIGGNRDLSRSKPALSGTVVRH